MIKRKDVWENKAVESSGGENARKENIYVISNYL